jgi:murein L,D-transpeptidase YafK
MSISMTFISRIPRTTLIFVGLCLLVLLLPSAVLASEASELIPYPLVSFSPEDGAAFAILVEKETQRLLLYEYRDTFSLKQEFACSTGKVEGIKEKSGDLKTPEGIYFFTKIFEKKHLAPIYGIRAFVMDYPNFSDRKFGREGNNIWLHGSDKPIKPLDSSGCIVMNNDDLEVLSRYIQLNRTPIVVAQKLDMIPAKSRRQDERSLTRFLRKWENAFVKGDWDRFRACYSKPNGNTDSLQRAWDRIRTFQQNDEFSFKVSFQNLTLLRGNPCAVALLDQVIDLDRQMKSVNTKQLFLEKSGKAWKITAEISRPDDPNRGEKPPLVAAVNRFDRLFTDHRAIVDLVAEWADAWSSKDIHRYRACYAPDFQAQEMDLAAWIRYKESLNKLYAQIRIGIEDLNIEQGLERSTATFLQQYDSSGYQAVGTKRLRLKRIGEEWKIYRETWQRIHD